MQPPDSKICVLCGIRKATTRDHVPPRGFFKGLKAQFITVPACAECNNGASSDDEDMRFFVSMQVGKGAPGAANLWESGALKSVKRKPSLLQQVISTAHEITVAADDGRETTRLAVAVPARLYDSVFGRVTRGLYFFHTGKILEATTKIQITPLDTPPAPEILLPFEKAQVADGAFSYWFGVAPEEPFTSLWLYCFYDNHWIQVRTGSTCDD